MFNARKLLGIIIALGGVFVSRPAPWLEEGSAPGFFVRITGVMIACVGIAVFASGIKNKIEKKIRVCPHCYVKNDAAQACCRSCKKPLTKTCTLIIFKEKSTWQKNLRHK